jgi:hypothetical protein
MGDRVFQNCTSLTNVGMSENITSIGDYVFDGCSALTELVLPESLTSIGYYLIRGTSISSITIPKNVKSCYYYRGSSSYFEGPLSGCKTLKTVIFEDGMKTIPDYVMASLYNKSYVETVIIPSSVTSIGSYAFYKCDKLFISELTEKVEKIGESAFEGCISIEGINIPKSIKSVGYSAFSGCTSLKTVTFNYNDEEDYICQMGDRVFQNCTSLTDVGMSENITSIGDYVFDGCSALTELVLPESLTSIGYYLIRGTSISSITIPKNVKSCDYYHGTSSYFEGPLSGCKTLKTVIFEDGMKAIPAYVMASLYNKSYVETVIIPSSVTSIGNYAFYNCNKMTIYGYAGSYAQTYAETNNIPFEEL